jgi:hypothetical protein
MTKVAARLKTNDHCRSEFVLAMFGQDSFSVRAIIVIVINLPMLRRSLNGICMIFAGGSTRPPIFPPVSLLHIIPAKNTSSTPF